MSNCECGDSLSIHEWQEPRACSLLNCPCTAYRPKDGEQSKQAENGTLPDGDEVEIVGDGKPLSDEAWLRLYSEECNRVISLSSQLQAERKRREAAEDVIDGVQRWHPTAAAQEYRQRYPQEEK